MDQPLVAPLTRRRFVRARLSCTVLRPTLPAHRSVGIETAAAPLMPVSALRNSETSLVTG